MVWSVSGCSSPRILRLISNVSSSNFAASALRPWSTYAVAKACLAWSVSGCSSPKILVVFSNTSFRRLNASARWPCFLYVQARSRIIMSVSACSSPWVLLHLSNNSACNLDASKLRSWCMYVLASERVIRSVWGSSFPLSYAEISSACNKSFSLSLYLPSSTRKFPTRSLISAIFLVRNTDLSRNNGPTTWFWYTRQSWRVSLLIFSGNAWEQRSIIAPIVNVWSSYDISSQTILWTRRWIEINLFDRSHLINENFSSSIKIVAISLSLDKICCKSLSNASAPESRKSIRISSGFRKEKSCRKRAAGGYCVRRTSNDIDHVVATECGYCGSPVGHRCNALRFLLYASE